MFQKHKLSFIFFLQKERGVTLIELSLVIALVAILVALSIPVYSKLQITSQLNESTSLLIQTLRTAQGRSVARLNNVEHGVRLELDSYTLYYGSSYAARIQDYDRVISLEGIELSWSLSGTGQSNEVNFSKGIGIPDMTGTITLTNEAQNTKNITINEIGKVEQ